VRTTLTIDDDVAAKLRQIARERDISFKQALNDALRQGLEPRASARRFRVQARELSLRRGIDLDKALLLAAEIEDAETIRKLELRK
jgi:predicted transcriptional regulator